MLLAGAYLPAMYAYGLSFWLIPPYPRGPNGPIHAESWSLHGLTLRGWQMYAGLGVFTLTAVSMVVGGLYFIFSSPRDD